jgi:hypothetical protein
MANPFRCHGLNVRTALVVAAALAMLPPLPARCASCATENGNCTHCKSGRAARHQGPCCQGNAADGQSSLAQHNTQAGQRGAADCACELQPAPRAVSQSGKFSLASPWDATLVSPSALPASLSAYDTARAASTRAGLPPPVPHRILHCSWLI